MKKIKSWMIVNKEGESAGFNFEGGAAVFASKKLANAQLKKVYGDFPSLIKIAGIKVVGVYITLAEK